MTINITVAKAKMAFYATLMTGEKQILLTREMDCALFGFPTVCENLLDLIQLARTCQLNHNTSSRDVVNSTCNRTRAYHYKFVPSVQTAISEILTTRHGSREHLSLILDPNWQKLAVSPGVCGEHPQSS